MGKVLRVAFWKVNRRSFFIFLYKVVVIFYILITINFLTEIFFIINHKVALKFFAVGHLCKILLENIKPFGLYIFYICNLENKVIYIWFPISFIFRILSLMTRTIFMSITL